MKYNAKVMKNGSWAVFTGKNYFTNTVTDSEREAREMAISMSMQFHNEQVRRLWDDLVELTSDVTPDNTFGKIKMFGSEDKYDLTDMGDLLC